MMEGRVLTVAERALVGALFGSAVDPDPVRIHHRTWWRFQPVDTVMAPDGAIWCHPEGGLFRDCYATSPVAMQALFVHEMVHVWQAQRKGRWYLPLMRHPFCRYDYALKPGRPFTRYGIEQQAEIVSDAFLVAHGLARANGYGLADYRAVIPFPMDVLVAEG